VLLDIGKEHYMTKTTEQWLNEIKSNPEKLTHWLQRQYVGEALAADRIQKLSDAVEGRFKVLLAKIAHDEKTHCQWVQGLLETRGISLPEVTIDNTRYWEPILDNLHSFEEIAGAGHHAEAMRLIRIKALAADQTIDTDIREVFQNILPDEEFHARAFAVMSSPEAIVSTRKLHEEGLEMLGLEV